MSSASYKFCEGSNHIKFIWLNWVLVSVHVLPPSPSTLPRSNTHVQEPCNLPEMIQSVSLGYSNFPASTEYCYLRKNNICVFFSLWPEKSSPFYSCRFYFMQVILYLFSLVWILYRVSDITQLHIYSSHLSNLHCPWNVPQRSYCPWF